MRNLRKKIWIDRFQTLLSFRIALYFMLYQVAVWSLVAIEHSMFGALEGVLGREATAYCFTFLVLGVVFMGFLFVYDAVKFSHRIVGPLYRFRKTIKAISEGEVVELITLRKHDYLQELKDDFNELIQALEQRGAVSVKPTGSRQEQHQHLPV